MCDDLSTLYEILFPAGIKWYNIGLNLMLSNDVLTKITVAQHENPDNCLREMLAKRLEAVGPLSWREVCACLRSPTVDRKDVAEKTEEWRKGIHIHLCTTIFTAIASYKYSIILTACM